MPVQAIPTASKRLRILGDEEIDALYGRPRFTPDERQEYFTFAPPELTALDEFHSPSNTWNEPFWGLGKKLLTASRGALNPA
jgi:hypothetical protein